MTHIIIPGLISLMNFPLLVITLMVNHYLNQNIPGIKRHVQVLKGIVEKDVKSKWATNTFCFDRFKRYGHDNYTAKHCYFRDSRPPDVDGIKFFDKR